MENKTTLEGNDRKPQPLTRWTVDQKKCTGCSECVDYCMLGLLKMVEGIVTITDETRCNQCERCLSACGALAIEFTHPHT